MSDYECGCGCNEEEFDEDYDLTFAYCTKCHRRVAVVEKNDNLKKLECCDQPMVNLDEIPTHVGHSYKCGKCGAEIIVEEDCLCSLEGKECGFVCCGQKMEEDVSSAENPCSCCGCDREEPQDETQFLYCPACKALVCVKTPCKCGDNCGIKCCGEKMIDLNDMVTYAGEVFICPTCSAKVLIEEEDYVISEEDYKPVECDGKPMVLAESEAEITDENLEKDFNTALYCRKCERIILTDKTFTGKINCCGQKMSDLSQLTDFVGEMYECRKCGLKIVIEEDLPGEEGSSAAPFNCCGTVMSKMDM